MGDSYFGMSLNVGKIDTIPCSGLGVMLGDGSLPSLDYPIQDKEISSKNSVFPDAAKCKPVGKNVFPKFCG